MEYKLKDGESDDWLRKVNERPCSLSLWYDKVRSIPLKDLGNYDLAMVILQKLDLKKALPIAIDRVSEISPDPLKWPSEIIMALCQLGSNDLDISMEDKEKLNLIFQIILPLAERFESPEDVEEIKNFQKLLDGK